MYTFYTIAKNEVLRVSPKVSIIKLLFLVISPQKIVMKYVFLITITTRKPFYTFRVSPISKSGVPLIFFVCLVS